MAGKSPQKETKGVFKRICVGFMREKFGYRALNQLNCVNKTGKTEKN